MRPASPDTVGDDDLFSHGYTNETSAHEAGLVRKRYSGTDARVRSAIEVACLVGLAGRLPVPRVVSSDGGVTVMRRMPGRHGQDLITHGRGYEVMHAAGELLRELQSLSPGLVPTLPGVGDFLIHGDFGAQNMLFDSELRVVAVLDWEFAHRGEAIEDVAWAEWIVRMHHPAAVDGISGLYEGYGSQPSWPARRTAMLQRCEELQRRCLREGELRAAEMWAERTEVTSRWAEFA